mmetsp:Transcript_17479/g.21255  ORF Transcript_17479/g.21255 Transcript_17479/m.21255 type:complete len:363 (+) Transcript_17479:360-1448(+)
MAAFDKAIVDVAELEHDELIETCQVLTGVKPTRTWKLNNGGCAANYGAELSDGRRCVIKAVIGSDCAQLASTQLAVLRALEERGIAPRPMCKLAVACMTKDKRPASAIAMQLLSGKPANLAVREGFVSAVAGYAAVGTALGHLHANQNFDRSNLPNAVDLSDPRYLEIFILRTKDGKLEDKVRPEIRRWLVEDNKISKIRKILQSSLANLKHGLLHGDPYSDNVMLLNPTDISPDAHFEARLIDWEDSSFGPLVYDLACALVAASFNYFSPDEQTQEDSLALTHVSSLGQSNKTDSNGIKHISANDSSNHIAALRLDILSKLLTNYTNARPDGLPHSEALALVDLMQANALACCTYRWHEFF